MTPVVRSTLRILTIAAVAVGFILYAVHVTPDGAQILAG